MHELGLFAKQPRAKYKSYKGEVGKTYNNKLLIMEVDETNHKTIYKRDFSTNKLNEKWTTDVSEFHIAAGKLYLSPILDMHNREIVSFNISRSPNFEQTLDMLNKAFEKYDDLSGLIFHSVFCYFLCVFPCRIDIIPSTPKFAIPIFEFHIPPFLIYHQTAFPFQISHKPGNAHFWWYLQQHVYMIWAYFSLYYCYFFEFT